MQLTSTCTTVEPGLPQHIDLARRVDVTNDLGNVRARTLVIAATQDRFVSPDHSHDLARAIPGAEWAELEAGHTLVTELSTDVLRLLTNSLEPAPAAQTSG